MRPEGEGPAMGRPGREAGVTGAAESSTEGAALKQKHIVALIRLRCGEANQEVPRLWRSFYMDADSRPDGRAYSMPALRA